MTISVSHIKPIYFLFIATGIFTLHCGVLASVGSPIDGWYGKLWNLTYSFIVAVWAHQKINKNKLSTPFEISAFLFFLWMLILPFYLYRIDKAYGVLKYFGILILSFIPSIIYLLIEVYYFLPQRT